MELRVTRCISWTKLLRNKCGYPEVRYSNKAPDSRFLSSSCSLDEEKDLWKVKRLSEVCRWQNQGLSTDDHTRCLYPVS